MDNLSSSSSIYDQTLNDDDSNESTFYTTDSPSLSSRSSSSSSTTIREQNNFHEDHDSTDNDSTIWHSFINDNNDDNQQYHLLQEKFQSIYQKLIFLQTDFERIEIFEQQLMDLSRQLSDYRLKITGQYSTLMKMFQELSDSRFGMVHAVPNCYQQQQRSSSLSLQENHSSNTKMVCLSILIKLFQSIYVHFLFCFVCV